MTADRLDSPCRRRHCTGTYEQTGTGLDDVTAVKFFECSRCGDLQTERQADPPQDPLFDLHDP